MPDLDAMRRSLPAFSSLVPATTRAPRTSPRNVPQASVAVAYSYDGKVGKPDARMYRHWSTNSEWIRGAVNIRRAQVSSAEWDIVPYDKGKPYSKREQKAIKRLFMRPNPANDSFRSFVEPIVEDIIVLDAGVVEKVRSLDGNLREMWPVDGATIKVNAKWDGSPDESRYYWYPDYKERATFKNADMLYMMANPRTNSPVGLSGLETLKQVIEAELFGHEYNRRQVAGAAPDGVMDLGEGMTQPDVERYRSYFESEVAGRGAIGFIGGSKGAKWIPFRQTSRDMQFLEWQIYLVRKIAVVLGLTPQDLGVTFDINRSTGETQLQISEDRGLRPLMSLLQDYFTEEVIWDPSFGGPENNLAFRFTALNLKESTAKAAILHQALAGVPWRFINEARLEEGREPIKQLEGKLVMQTPTGAVDIMDIPTVREQMEQVSEDKKAAKPAGPPPKSAEIAEHEGITNGVLAAFRSMSDPPAPPIVNVAAAPAPVVNIARQPAPVVNVAAAPAPVVNIDNAEVAKAIASLKELLARDVTPPPVTRREVKRDVNGRIVEVIDHRGK